MDLELQIMNGIVLFTGATGAWLQSHHSMKHKYYGFIVGLLSQPLWFTITYLTHNWGIFVLCFWFTACYVRGIITHRRILFKEKQ